MPAPTKAAALLAAAAAVSCALTPGPAPRPRGEMRYVHEFCEAHALVGVVNEVDLALRLELARLTGTAIGGSSARATLLQQDLQGYSTRWQHLHQSMTTACRDFASCRYRAEAAAAPECDGLRERLDDVVRRGQQFLLELEQLRRGG